MNDYVEAFQSTPTFPPPAIGSTALTFTTPTTNTAVITANTITLNKSGDTVTSTQTYNPVTQAYYFECKLADFPLNGRANYAFGGTRNVKIRIGEANAYTMQTIKNTVLATGTYVDGDVFAFTLDGTDVNVYMNGTSIASKTMPSTEFLAADTVMVTYVEDVLTSPPVVFADIKMFEIAKVNAVPTTTTATTTTATTPTTTTPTTTTTTSTDTTAAAATTPTAAADTKTPTTTTPAATTETAESNEIFSVRPMDLTSIILWFLIGAFFGFLFMMLMLYGQTATTTTAPRFGLQFRLF